MQQSNPELVDQLRRQMTGQSGNKEGDNKDGDQQPPGTS